MISLVDVEKVYRTDRIETLALSGINLEVEPGEFVSVMGPSGCGKSTLLNLMGLLDAPTSGEVALGGRRITAYTDRLVARIRNERVGFIFQSFHLIPDLNVLDNIEIPLLYRKGISGRQRRALVAEAVERVGLASRSRHFPAQLSGGQQQRIAIARAIVGKPDLILADEPTGNLDSRMGDEVMQILIDLNAGGTTVVMVTHSEQLAGRTRRILRLFDGRLVN